MADNINPVSVLEEDSCWGFLAGTEVGRLATAVLNVPEIFPVNFCLDGESVVFRSASGTKLDELTQNHAVTFEADGWDGDGGWSVVIHGSAELITDQIELARAAKMPLRPWIATDKPNYVRIVPDTITGRTFVFGPLTR